jgi:hypothetical protein
MADIAIFYDWEDEKYARKLGDRRFQWIEELGGGPRHEADPGAEGFLFGYQGTAEDYRRTVRGRPNVRDRLEEREELRHLDAILKKLDHAGAGIPRPKSWVMGIDDRMPPDIEFPVFVRTTVSSWKRGGQISCVKNARQLDEEMFLLRRAFQWNATIIARQWLTFEPAGSWRYGKVPQEIRVWIVDHVPAAWSFHYLQAVPKPNGFPPSTGDLRTLARYAAEIGPLFASRLVAVDFARTASGEWYFVEAGSGACSGTAHEGVFKAVVERLARRPDNLQSDAVGGEMVPEA